MVMARIEDNQWIIIILEQFGIIWFNMCGILLEGKKGKLQIIS